MTVAGADGRTASRATPGAIRSLLAVDARTIARDPLLLLSLFLPLLTGLALRWGFPWAADRLPDFPLAAYALFAVGFALVQCPLLVGFVAGFMLLDERDEGVLAAIATTPLGGARFLAWRLLLPAAAAVPAILAAIAIAGLGVPPLPQLAAAVLLAATEAPLATLLLAAFAANKVEGLALAKAAGIAVAAPFAALLVPMPWQGLAGVFPQFWAVRLFALADAPAAALAATVCAGAAVHVVWAVALRRAFRRRGGL